MFGFFLTAHMLGFIFVILTNFMGSCKSLHACFDCECSTNKVLVQCGSLRNEITQCALYVYFMLQVFDEMYQRMFRWFFYVRCYVDIVNDVGRLKLRKPTQQNYVRKVNAALNPSSKRVDVGTMKGYEPHNRRVTDG